MMAVEVERGEVARDSNDVSEVESTGVEQLAFYRERGGSGGVRVKTESSGLGH